MEAHSPYNNTWNYIYNYIYIYIFFIILILWSDSVAQILYFEKQCRKNTNMDIWSKFTIEVQPKCTMFSFCSVNSLFCNL